tara:strand:+ start:6736 stop:7107 length:372 start_codon:yes stop_codon:yes gene_type:complete
LKYLVFLLFTACSFSPIANSRKTGVSDCSQQAAFQLGRQGGVYQHRCSLDKSEELLTAFEKGRQLYLKERSLQQLKTELRRLQRKEHRLSGQVHQRRQRDLQRQILSAEQELRFEEKRLLNSL